MHGVDRYQQILRFTKIALPICALMLLSVMFLIAKTPNLNVALPYSDADVPIVLDGMRNARTTGVSDAGSVIDARAELVTPSDASVSMSVFKLDLTSADGAITNVTSYSAEFTNDGAQAWLRDNVVIRSSGGFSIFSDALRGDLDEDFLTSPETVSADGPFGDIKAGKMEMTLASNTQSSRIVFSNGVELTYLPSSAREKPE